MLTRIIPPLQIHVWGGLGSQLFGAALAFDIQSRFSFRRTVLVLHSSGVTRRLPEIKELFPELNYRFVDDFVIKKNQESNGDSFASNLSLRHFFKILLLKFSLIALENDDLNYRIRFWTIQVRGHYFYRTIKDEFIELVGQRLELISKLNPELFINHVAIHYRLGDLLDLDYKLPVQSARIATALNLASINRNILMFSDSPSIATELLAVEIPEHRIKLQSLDILETLFACTKAEFFIGTSSKISYWIVLIRSAYQKNTENYLPIEDLEIMRRLNANSKFYCYR